MLIAAAYVSQEQGWRTPSSVFVLTPDRRKFVLHHTVATVGAHDVEAITIASDHFLFFSSDREGDNTRIQSELFKWIPAPTGTPTAAPTPATTPTPAQLAAEGRFISVQKVWTNGAHAAEFFRVAEHSKSGCDGARASPGEGGDGGGVGDGGGASGADCYYLAVANLGSRQRNKYRTQSHLYRFNPTAATTSDPAAAVQPYLQLVHAIATASDRQACQQSRA